MEAGAEIHGPLCRDVCSHSLWINVVHPKYFSKGRSLNGHILRIISEAFKAIPHRYLDRDNLHHHLGCIGVYVGVLRK